MSAVDALNATLHDAYAADYDQQVQSYGCHVADLLFRLCYEPWMVSKQ